MIKKLFILYGFIVFWLEYTMNNSSIPNTKFHQAKIPSASFTSSYGNTLNQPNQQQIQYPNTSISNVHGCQPPQMQSKSITCRSSYRQPMTISSPIHRRNGFPQPFNPRSKPQQINPIQDTYQQLDRMRKQLPTPMMSMQGYSMQTTTLRTSYNQFVQPSSVKVTTSKSSTRKEKTESEMISHMVSSAKSREWDNVWEVLSNKPHLVNCIPSDRAWSILHQAVWQNNVQAVEKILSYPACDTEIRTKQDKANKSGPGKKPIDLARYQQVKNILQSRHAKQIMSSETPTMLPVYAMLNSLGGCIHMTLSCNQGVLIPPKWPIEDHNTVYSIPYLMQAIFCHINRGDNWVNTRNKVSLTLQQYSKALGDKLWRESESMEDSKHMFFSRIIQIYTEERRSICKELNKMLRLQHTSTREYQPTGLDLSLCPFALLLNSILLHWNELKGYTGITYRSCSLTKEQAKLYVKGQQFIWMSFSSSTKRRGAYKAANYSHEARIYEFVIDNGTYNHKWAPRGIAKYSAFVLEEECLYPFGAKFEVTDLSCDKVNIRLIDY